MFCEMVLAGHGVALCRMVLHAGSPGRRLVAEVALGVAAVFESGAYSEEGGCAWRYG